MSDDEIWINPPVGQELDWPDDLDGTDNHYLRMYIKWKYPGEVDKMILPVMSNSELVDFLKQKGYTLGARVKAQNNERSGARTNGN